LLPLKHVRQSIMWMTGTYSITYVKKTRRPKAIHMIKFNAPEERFLKRNELGRLGTISPKGMPHVVPVCYIYQGGNILIATDYQTRKYRNLRANNRVAFVVDVYKPNRAILIQGRANLLERGSEFQEAYRLFYNRFSWVRADPWKEGEAPFIKIESTNKISWGLSSK